MGSVTPLERLEWVREDAGLTARAFSSRCWKSATQYSAIASSLRRGRTTEIDRETANRRLTTRAVMATCAAMTTPTCHAITDQDHHDPQRRACGAAACWRDRHGFAFCDEHKVDGCVLRVIPGGGLRPAVAAVAHAVRPYVVSDRGATRAAIEVARNAVAALSLDPDALPEATLAELLWHRMSQGWLRCGDVAAAARVGADAWRRVA